MAEDYQPPCGGCGKCYADLEPRIDRDGFIWICYYCRTGDYHG